MTDLAGYLPLTGGKMNGYLAMGPNGTTSTGPVFIGSLAASLTTGSTSTFTGALVSAGELGVAEKAFIGLARFNRSNRKACSHCADQMETR